VNPNRIELSAHAFERMFERGISVAAVVDVLRTGREIETYTRGGGLVLGRVAGRPLHVVYATTPLVTLVVTAYWPDPARWDADFTNRVNR
jgi:hypothetical protein